MMRIIRTIAGLSRNRTSTMSVSEAATMLAGRAADKRRASEAERRERVTAALRRYNQRLDLRTPEQRTADALERARWLETRLMLRRARRLAA